MIKRQKNNTKKKRNGKGFKENDAEARKINASTVYETCTEQLSPFWRYVDSLGINQANSFLKIISALRERGWQLCDINNYKIRIIIDTTVETFFGNQHAAAKGIIPNTVAKRHCAPFCVSLMRPASIYIVQCLEKDRVGCF